MPRKRRSTRGSITQRDKGSWFCRVPRRQRRSCPRVSVHPKPVSECLGHSTVAFTMDVYSAVIPSMGRAAADAANLLFGEGGA